MPNMTPPQIVNELNNYIVGQQNAKRAVAIALRNRWRRMQLNETLRNEITPKNILMIGPTGVGKTEIARRLAKLSNAPFIKVEATKFTEVGYVGKEVDSIIKELTDSAIKMIKLQLIEKNKNSAIKLAEERILDVLIPSGTTNNWNKSAENTNSDNSELTNNTLTRKNFRKKLRDGILDDKEIEINLSITPMDIEIMSPPGMEEMTNQLQSIFKNLAGQKQKIQKMKIKDAFKLLIEEEATKLINPEEIKDKAIKSVEQHGIVFIDEIDKICKKGEITGSDISREGVQRDLLPLVEGCTVFTKHGMVKTDHILFIASGAFHISSPSDLIPELQGRLPIQVKLEALSIVDFEKILTEPHTSLTMQYISMMKTEGIHISFTKDGIQSIAEIAWNINACHENIGARRLHTVLEYLMEDISFDIDKWKDTTININSAYVREKLNNLISNEDLSNCIL